MKTIRLGSPFLNISIDPCGTHHLASPHPPALPLPLAPSLCFNSCARSGLIIRVLLRPQDLCAHSQSWFTPLNLCVGLIISLHPTPLPSLSLSRLHFVPPFGPVQVQTLEEPEPDLKSGSLEVQFKFRKICEPDPKSGSRFREISL